MSASRVMRALTVLLLACAAAGRAGAGAAAGPGMAAGGEGTTDEPSAAELADGARSYVELIECRKHYNPKSAKDPEKNLRSCVDEYLSPSVPDWHKAELEQWLLARLKTTAPHRCSRGESAFLRDFKSTPRIFLCFELRGRASQRGYLFYDKVGDRVLISDIKVAERSRLNKKN